MVLILLVSIPQSGAMAVSGSSRNALIMSSVDKLVPLGSYGGLMKSSLQSMGYSVTTVNDGRITLDFITTNLNNYNVIIWRTNSFTWNHGTYWYVGEQINPQTQAKYSDDFNTGRAVGETGIIGVSASFFMYHYSNPLQPLKNVKLAILVSSYSFMIANILQSAGVQSVIFCGQAISLGFGIIDDLTAQLVAYLKMGQSVSGALLSLIAPYSNHTPEDPLDNYYEPPFWYVGDPNVAIT